MKPCILPWINFSTNTFGRPRVCGYSSLKSDKKLKNTTISEEWNSDYFREIRKDFLNNKWPKNCSRCEHIENLGGVSKRKDENSYWYNVYEDLIDQTNSDGSVPYIPPHIDVRTGMICNLKCIHCGTGASSKWQEDKPILDKYPNTENYKIDNKWIEQETTFWDNLRNNIKNIKKFNFLGGESFANKQHNLFLKDLSKSEYAEKKVLAYTTNALLITEETLLQLDNFEMTSLRISIDAIEDPLEYFRYPTKWDKLYSQIDLIDRFTKGKKNFNISFQWTSSNISMFYLVETYEKLRSSFKNIEFTFCNHVDWPEHMNSQNLPIEIKKQIIKKIDNYEFKQEHKEVFPFYVKHMIGKDLWSVQGNIFMNYLDDLDKVRNINWKNSFKEMDLTKYDSR